MAVIALSYSAKDAFDGALSEMAPFRFAADGGLNAVTAFL